FFESHFEKAELLPAIVLLGRIHAGEHGTVRSATHRGQPAGSMPADRSGHAVHREIDELHMIDRRLTVLIQRTGFERSAARTRDLFHFGTSARGRRTW